MIILRFWLKSNINIMPLDVPSTTCADTATHVGAPKFRLPTSEKACPFSFRSLVHLTTSHGGDGDSMSPRSSTRLLTIESCRPCRDSNAGEDGLGDRLLGVSMREEKRRSKGRKEGVGLPSRGRVAKDGRMLLPGEEINDPWQSQITSRAIRAADDILEQKGYHRVWRALSPRDFQPSEAGPGLPQIHCQTLQHRCPRSRAPCIC